MININIKKILLNLTIILLIFLIDRISKVYILNIAETTGLVDIELNSYLNLILVWNTGIGFGLLSFEQTSIYNSANMGPKVDIGGNLQTELVFLFSLSRSNC